MHDDIKKFTREGYISDTNLVRDKEWQVNDLEKEMREHGYVPVLDLEPQFTLDYDPESETYLFTLSIYSVHVGKENSWDTAGMMTGNPIMKHTTNPK